MTRKPKATASVARLASRGPARRTSQAKRPKAVTAWARMLRSDDGPPWQLCYWAFPDKDMLMLHGKPSPEARAVSVRIAPLAPRKAKRKA